MTLYYTFDYGKTLDMLLNPNFAYLGFCNAGYYCGDQDDIYNASINPC